MRSVEEKIKILLNRYQPTCKYLEKIEANYPIARGICRIDQTYYTTNPLHHITAVESILCLNQASYAALAIWLENGAMGFTIPFENFHQLISNEQLYIVHSQMHFKKNIPKGSFPLLIQITRHKKIGSVVYLDMAYELGNSRAFYGTLDVCIQYHNIS